MYDWKFCALPTTTHGQVLSKRKAHDISQISPIPQNICPSTTLKHTYFPQSVLWRQLKSEEKLKTEKKEQRQL